MLEDLGLTARRDVPIKHLSGGQRKRVSIGAELLSKPTLFFLDEPTSGLDPGLEGRMMGLLRKLADQGRTVVLITHATQNVDLCDNIAFLAPGGYLAYYGPPGEALAYFGVEKFAEIYTAIEQAPAMEAWPQRFRASPLWQKHVGAHLAAAAMGGDGATGAHAAGLARAQARPPASRRVSSLRQFAILTRRYLETLRRDRRTLLTLLAQAPIIALMIGLVFRHGIFDTTPIVAGGQGDNSLARRLLFLLAMVAVWFGTSNAAREIVKEAAIYARERRINLKLGPYVASKFVVLGGLACAQNLFLLLPPLLVGAGPLRLPLLYAGLVCGALAGVGMGLAISALAPNPDRAASLVPIALIPQIIFSGVIIGLSGAGSLLSHLMVTKWTYRALGATLAADAVPLPRQELGSAPPGIAPQLVAGNPQLTYDAGSQTMYLLPSHGNEFTLHPLVYLAILALFILASLLLVIYFQRRKDRVR